MDSVVIRSLDRAGIEDVLRRNAVGRLAFITDESVDIEPIHYVYHAGNIFARTTGGTKLAAIARHHRVAFEVDESDSLFEWRSVVVKGPMLRVPTEARDEWSQAIDALRRLVPEAFTEDDPTPDRTVVFRIPADRATGRVASGSMK